MKLGIDFDNTIVNYHEVIERLASKLSGIPQHIPKTKIRIRDYLRGCGREEEWTELQGQIYGPGMIYAKPYRGAIQAMKEVADKGYSLIIVSHRTRYPYRGTRHDLHKAAYEWVKRELWSEGLFQEKDGCSCVHFLETRAEKIQKIGLLECDYFIDDLPEVLEDEGFPNNTRRILFHPKNESAGSPSKEFVLMRDWTELKQVVM